MNTLCMAKGRAVACLAFALALALTPAALRAESPLARHVPITSKRSLAYVGIFFPESSDGATSAAKLLYDGLCMRDAVLVKQARDMYSKLIPKENFGGEYTALQWFADYYLSSHAERRAMLKDPDVAYYFNFFAGQGKHAMFKSIGGFLHLCDDGKYAVLKEYLERHYHLKVIKGDPEQANDRSMLLQDMIVDDNPRRADWEKSADILSALDVKPGDKIADLGCGGGYYTFKLAA